MEPFNQSLVSGSGVPTHTQPASTISDFDTEVANNTTVAANTSKLAGIEAGAEVNNISDVNATDLTDGGDSSLHYHSADRNRSNHTGTQTLATISDAGTIASQDANSVNITGGSVTGITDLAIADGGTGAGTAAGARTNLDVYSTGEVDEYLAPKATAGGVKFDGVSGDILTEFQYPINTDATFSITFSTESAGYPLTFCRTSNTTGRAIEFQVESGGTVMVWFFDASLNAKYRISGINFLDGVLRTITVTVSGTTLAFYVNGSSVSATYSGGTFAGFVSGNYRFSIASRRAAAVNQFMELTCIDFAIFNRALTASEVADLYRNGLAGIADADRWGSNNAADGGPYFASCTDNGTASTTKFDFSLTGAYGNQTIRFPGLVSAGSEVEIKLSNVSSSGGSYRTRINNYAGTAANSSYVTISGDGVYTMTATNADASGLRILVGATNFSSGTFTADIDYIKINGAIAAYPMDEGIGYQLHDISSNHYDGLLSTSGFTHLVPKTEGYIRDFGVDAYNGGSGNAELVNGTRDILPQGKCLLTELLLSNGNSGGSVAGNVDLRRTQGGTSQATVQSFTSKMSPGDHLYANSFSVDDVSPSTSAGTYLVRRNLAISTPSITGATNLDVRVDYKVI